ncbi:MAG: hypothetical protein U1E21_09980 [Reyranellaceae bacterium]
MIRQWLLATSLFAALPVLAQTGNCPGGPPDWIVANTTHCKLWNGCPQLDERATWTAACVGGFAERRGVTMWFQGGRPGDRYEGTMRAGRMDGRGILTKRNGDRYEGDWRDDRRNGRGVYSYANGGRYEGEWRDDERNGNGIISLAMAIGTMEHRETASPMGKERR